MHIRKGRESDRAFAESIWGAYFESPTDPFFRWYFKNCYAPEHLLIGNVDGVPVCNLHRRPYTLSVRGKAFDTDYLVGVATDEAHRHHGYATVLVRSALNAAQEEGKAFVMLMPSEAALYRVSGFAFYAFQWERSGVIRDMSNLCQVGWTMTELTDDGQWKTLSRLYEGFTKNRSGYALRREADWKRLMAGQLAEGQIFLVADETGTPEGYVFCKRNDRCLLVGEAVLTHEEASLSSLLGMIGGGLTTWYAPLDTKDFYLWDDGAEETHVTNRTFPMMMGRIVDPVAAFDGLPCEADRESTLRVCLFDGAMEENRGTYRLTAKHGVVHCEKTDEPSDCAMDVETLTTWFFGAMDLCELSKTASPLLHVHWKEDNCLLREVWTKLLPTQKNWISEWY